MKKWLCILAIALIANSAHAAQNYTGKRFAVASMFNDKARLHSMETMIIANALSAYDMTVPEWQIDQTLESGLIKALASKFKATGHVVADKSSLPAVIEFGFVGPSDDALTERLANSEHNADYLILLYSTNFMAGSMLEGVGFSQSNIGLRHAVAHIKFVMFDLVNNKYVGNEEVHMSESYDFTRAPVKKELDAIYKHVSEDETNNEKLEKMKAVVYATPFDGKKVLSMHQSLYSSVTGFDEAHDDLYRMIYEVTNSILPDPSAMKPSEVAVLGGILQKALVKGIGEYIEAIDPANREDEF